MKKKVQEYEGGEEFIMEFADACYVCGIGDDEDKLLVCDRCDYKICHYTCCGFSKIPNK